MWLPDMTQDLVETYAPPDWWLEVRRAFQMALDLEVRAETWGCVSASEA